MFLVPADMDVSAGQIAWPDNEYEDLKKIQSKLKAALRPVAKELTAKNKAILRAVCDQLAMCMIAKTTCNRFLNDL